MSLVQCNLAGTVAVEKRGDVLLRLRGVCDGGSETALNCVQSILVQG